jgi:glycerol uptake facilitator-like aquaporin
MTSWLLAMASDKRTRLDADLLDAPRAFRHREWRQLAAEAVGTALLLAIIVGSGIMAERLFVGQAGPALLANAIATGAGLVVLILAFAPVSGAHFNPLVTLVFLARRELPLVLACRYVAAQFMGAILGVMLAHVMFDLPIVQVSLKSRDGLGQFVSEIVATFGLIGAILSIARTNRNAVPFAVGLYITAAYWFTASTAFANPAVTFARSLTDTFAGIAPSSTPTFLLAQLIGTLLSYVFFVWLQRTEIHCD